MRRKTRFLTSVAAVSVAWALSGAAVDAATLEEAVRTTVTTNPEIGAIRNNRKAIDQELRAARGQYFPSVDLRGAFGHEFSNNPATRNRPGREDGEDGWVNMNRYEANATLTQVLFDGFKIDSDVERNIARVESAKFRVFDTAEAVGLRAVESYLEVLRAGEVVTIAEQNVRTHEDTLRRVAARSKAGRGPLSDVDQARARLASAKVVLADTRGRFQDSVANYIAVVGNAPEDLQPVVAPELELPSNLEEAVSLAIANSPAIAIRKADLGAAESRIKTAQSEFYPKVNLEVQGNWNRNIDGVRGVNKDLQGLVVGTWNVFRGGIDVARTQEARERVAQARDDLDLIRRETEQEVRLSWNALNAARERRVAVSEQLAANKKVRDAYFQQFELGQRTLLDLLDIDNELFNSQTALVTENFTVAFGVYRVLGTMGMMLRTMGIELPKEAKTPPRASVFD